MSNDLNMTCGRCGYFGGLHVCEPKTAPATDSLTVEAATAPVRGEAPVETQPRAGATSLADSNMLKVAEVILMLTNQAGVRDERIEQLEAQVLNLNRRLIAHESRVVSVPFLGTVT